jgi:triosephosphate isomerase (TIM)
VSAPLRPILAGNWKMNLGPSQAARFCDEFLALWEPRDDRSVVLFPAAIAFAAVRDALRGRADVRLGVQNLHWEAGGAFTGETSVAMAADAGAELALVGHSERRWVFGESIDHTVSKVRAVLDGGLTPVLCVGEKIEERRGGGQDDVVRAQLAPVLEAVSPGEARSLVVAYEPVWAIGTGVNATPDDAGSMHAFIRAELATRYGHETADRIPLLYGGSVKPDNAAALLGVPGVDGVLVGGASLDPRGFAEICAAR